MATIAKLTGELRTEHGSTACRRLRKSGRVPANLYGHGQDPAMLSVDEDALKTLVTTGARVVDLQLNGKSETALIREVQWDTFGMFVKHFDMMRIDAQQRIHVEVPIVLRGTAPGILAGGIMEQPVHKLHVECLAIEVPDFIAVKVVHLDLNQSIHVRDLTDLPAGLVVKSSPDMVIVHIVQPQAEEASADATAPGEPEVIGKKKVEGEEGAAAKAPDKKK